MAVSKWEIEKGLGGSWDDQAFEAFTDRIGLELHISPDARTGIKQPIRQDKGALGLVKLLRNQLAHGSLSFSECGAGVTVADLKDIKNRTETYLREVVQVFHDFIDGYRFLIPERRPAGGSPA